MMTTNLKTFPVSWLKEQDIEGKLHKDISIQRNEVWNPIMKSNFIAAILLDIPIESLLLEKAGMMSTMSWTESKGL